MRFIAAQIIGAFGIVILMICFHFKNMKNVLKIKFLADVVWATHYFLLGGDAAGISNTICCVREIIYMNKDKKIFKSNVWPFIFVGCNIFFGILGWKGIYSMLPATASVLATFSFAQKDVKIARRIALIINILMFTYDIFVLSYMGMVSESLGFISVVAAMIINRK